jgi:hypothetical protein
LLTQPACLSLLLQVAEKVGSLLTKQDLSKYIL